MSDAELLVQRTIATISQADPLTKLLEQVRLGRMTRSDPGLLAITDGWIATYRKALASPELTKQVLRRIDPTPRLAVLMEERILPADHAEARALLTDYEHAIARAPI
jgi:hypothetical protein